MKHTDAERAIFIYSATMSRVSLRTLDNIRFHLNLTLEKPTLYKERNLIAKLQSS